MSITPKYKIGDIVWFVSTDTTRGRHPCPDCLGTRKWYCKSATGLELDMDCPRCTRSHGWKENLDLSYTKSIAYSRKLTIGSVRMDTADQGSLFKYMCVETGVGSGSVYNESDLYDNEEEADRYATTRCAILQAEYDKQPEAMTTLAHSKMGYFESMKTSAKREAMEEVRDSYRDRIDETEDKGHTPGIWFVRNESEDSAGVYSFSISAMDPAKGGWAVQVCSGYGGLSDGFASKEHGPGNALRLAASATMFNAIEKFEGWWNAEGQALIQENPECVTAILEAAAKARGEKTL